MPEWQVRSTRGLYRNSAPHVAGPARWMQAFRTSVFTQMLLCRKWYADAHDRRKLRDKGSRSGNAPLSPTAQGAERDRLPLASEFAFGGGFAAAFAALCPYRCS